MGRLTRLTGGTVTASEGGKGKRLGVLVLAGVALLVVVRLLTRGGDDTEDDSGIDTISTEDEGPETVTIGSEDEEDSEESADDDEETEDSEESDDGGSGISVQAIDRQDVDLFDVIAIVGEALRAAREEYDRRAA